MDALTAEYQNLFALCRPLMRILNFRGAEAFQRTAESLAEAAGDAYLYCSMPTLFTMPEQLVSELSEHGGNEAMISQWKQSLALFREKIKKQRLTLALPVPECALLTPDALHPSVPDLFSACDLTYTKEQYALHIEQLISENEAEGREEKSRSGTGNRAIQTRGRSRRRTGSASLSPLLMPVDVVCVNDREHSVKAGAGGRRCKCT